MSKLPMCLAMMQETNLPVTDVAKAEGRVEISWSRPPEQHEKELAQRCTLFQPVVHKF